MGLFNRDRKKAEVPTHSLADILRGLQEAVGAAGQMLEAQQAEAMARYWDSDGRPATVRVQAGGRDIEVPLFALVPHSHLVMDGVELHLRARVGGVTASPVRGVAAPAEGEGPQTFTTSAGMQVSVEDVRASDDDAMDITIRFRTGQTPEAVSRLVDDYCKDL